jgi:hypothetical protein
MLLIKTTENFRQVLKGMYTPLVFLPASAPGEAREEAKARAKGLALDARIAGYGVTVAESKDGELFVLVSSNESQVVGFARKLLAESRTAEAWFLLLRTEKGPVTVTTLVKETADRTREASVLTKTGLVLGGRAVEIVASYDPAQNNTSYLHHLGVDVGETL